ncbi:MAG: SUMF1/EgtB/PvdO family nonheme iron enzyme [Aliishimia sp.]
MPSRKTRMVDVSGGQFLMGSDRHYPEEAPTRLIDVPSFRMDAACVTNDEFAAFVDATGYVTTSERPLDPKEQPNMPEAFYAAGSLVFRKSDHPVRLTDPSQWWDYIAGACWKRPEGPDSTLSGRGDHPVVHVSYVDASAYARWAGKGLATEEQWEYAAATACPEPATLNIWRGIFPVHNERTNVAPFTVPARLPVSKHSALHHMLGNVWEWTSSIFETAASSQPNCCSRTSATGVQIRKRILKGGSYLCADSYCRRYRPAARIAGDEVSTAGHIGFRCVEL